MSKLSYAHARPMRAESEPEMMVDGQMEESAVDVAMTGLRHLLLEEKRENSTTAAVNHCQVTRSDNLKRFTHI